MGFLNSSKKIYETMQWGGDIAEARKKDVFNILSSIESKNWYWSATTNKLTPTGIQAQVPTPWVHADVGIIRRCGLDHQIVFDLFGIISPRCLKCWKTVVTPRTVEELLQLKDLQQKVFQFPCKCGIEMRDYVPKLYGGYHYADSLEDGLEMYAAVKELVAEHINEELADTTILKRGCTEYEFIKGPSSKWEITDNEMHIFNLIEHYVDNSHQVNMTQTKEAKQHVILNWFRWAHMHGDLSYIKYNGNKPLFPGYETYHDKD